MQDWQLAARSEIVQLHTRYVFLVDHKEATEFSRLFAEDGVLVSTTGREIAGRAEIRDYIVTILATRTDPSWSIRHHITPPDIVFRDERHATTECYFVAFNTTSLDHWGVYTADVVRQDSGWTIATWRVAIEGSSPEGWIGSGSVFPSNLREK